MLVFPVDSLKWLQLIKQLSPSDAGSLSQLPPFRSWSMTIFWWYNVPFPQEPIDAWQTQSPHPPRVQSALNKSNTEENVISQATVTYLSCTCDQKKLPLQSILDQLSAFLPQTLENKHAHNFQSCSHNWSIGKGQISHIDTDIHQL